MKKNQLLTLAIVFGVLLSSCGSLSVSRMRYTKGLNIGLFSAKEAKPEEIKAKKAEKKQIESLISASNETSSKNRNVANAENVLLKSIELNQINSEVEANISSIDNEKLNNNRFSRKEIKKALKNNSKLDVSNSVTSLSSQKDNISNASESNTPTILLVILSLIPILALIAIYLHQGEINIKFWIDLILHFLFLYSLYALLVVLDVL